MEVRKKNQNNINHTNNNAPKRGGAGYWFNIIFFGFIIPFLVFSGASGMLLYQVNPKLFLLGVPTSFILALWFAHRAHQKMQRLNDKDYAACFNIEAPSPTVVETSYDKDSTLYWTFGPGSASYKEILVSAKGS